MLLYLTSFEINPIPQCERATGNFNESKQRAPEPPFASTSQKTNAMVLVSFTAVDIRGYLQNSGLHLGLDSNPFKSQVYLVWVEEEEGYLVHINSQNKG